MDPTNQHRQIVPHNVTPISPPINQAPTNPPSTMQNLHTTHVPQQQGVETNINTNKDIDSKLTPDDMGDGPHSKN